ncbi:MAG: NAD(P)/FAD-dependent oxidoreductase [Candidatus Latescibacterota bacterium]|jgi:D-amino-acid dehydrogenase
MQYVEVLIIGGGVAGVCAAHALARRGHEVVLLEKGEICAGASHGNAGLIVPSHSVPLAEPGAIAQGMKWLFNPESPFYIKWRWDRALWSWLWHFRRAATHARVRQAMPLLRDMHLESLRLFQALAGEIDFEFGQRGRLLLCRTQRGLEVVGKEADLMRAIGLEVQLLDAEGVRALDSNVVFDCVGAAYYAQDAHVQPAHFVRALAGHASQLGAELCVGTEVLDIEGHNGHIERVRTTRGDYAAAHIVLAGGAWSPQLVENLELKLPIQPAKGYSVGIDRPEACPQIPFMLTEAKVAVTPLEEQVRFAGTLEMAGLDFSLNRRRVDAMLRAVADYVPAWSVDHLKVREVWRGLRPCSPDGLPFIGRANAWDNLIVAAGHGMCGLSLGPVTGEIVAHLVVGDGMGFNLDLCRVGRFS